jgi:hypothetical protein
MLADPEKHWWSGYSARTVSIRRLPADEIGQLSNQSTASKIKRNFQLNTGKRVIHVLDRLAPAVGLAGEVVVPVPSAALGITSGVGLEQVRRERRLGHTAERVVAERSRVQVRVRDAQQVVFRVVGVLLSAVS